MSGAGRQGRAIRGRVQETIGKVRRRCRGVAEEVEMLVVGSCRLTKSGEAGEERPRRFRDGDGDERRRRDQDQATSLDSARSLTAMNRSIRKLETV